jgi:RNA polymerase sigma-70 factor (ECF subfamily)
LLELLPELEVMGLLALMLLHESRRTARASITGDLVLLENQDRSLWNRPLIAEGTALVEKALMSRRFGPYTLQAAISAVHAESATAKDTDWPQIVALYDVLLQMEPSPVVRLDPAVAVAMRDGPAAALPLIDDVLKTGEVTDYHLAHGPLPPAGAGGGGPRVLPAGAGVVPTGARAAVLGKAARGIG